jgi:hypothetical protein
MLKKIILILIVFTVFLSAGNFNGSFAVAEKYPQLDISGCKKWLYSDFNVNPQANYELAVENRFSEVGSTSPWTEQLALYIAGRLNEELGVIYRLRQNTAAVDHFDVTVDYRNYSLIFGHPQQYFGKQELALHDYADGVGIGGSWDKLKAVIYYGRYPTGYVDSETLNFADYKIFRNPSYNGEKVYAYGRDDPYLEFLSLDLGRVDIVEESVGVYVDNQELVRDADFYVDSAYGLVLISSSYKRAKEAKVTFLLSGGGRREVTFDIKKDTRRRAFLSPDFRIVDGSEIVTVDGMRWERDLDYRANYNFGLFIMNEPLPEDAEVRIDYNYSYGASLFGSDTITNQSGHTFNLSYQYILRESETVILNGQTLTPYIDYTMDYVNGEITFIYKVGGVTFFRDLVFSDVAEISYSYSGIRQDVMAANAEYALAAWSKIGSSVISISPSQGDEVLFGQISPSSYLIWNLYNRTALNENTFIDAEYSMSSRNLDFRNSDTIEADSAMKVAGRTRFGNLELSGAYRKTGFNYASLRMVKTNTGWKNEKSDIGARYRFADSFTLKGGVETGIEQEGDMASPEVNSSVTYSGIETYPLDFLRADFDFRERREETPFRETRQDSSFSRFTLDTKFLSCEDSKLIAKLYDEQSRTIGVPAIVTSDTRLSRYELGWRFELSNGLSGYVSQRQEEEKDLVAVTTTTRDTPLYRAAYEWNLGGGHRLEFHGDYSTTQQRGVTDYDRVDRGFGMVWHYPPDNPVVSAFQMGTTTKTTDYQDINDSSNNYLATEVRFYGTLVF